jgi:putative ATP-binding cassette transporter
MGLAATLFFLSDQRFVLALFAYRKDNEKFQASLRDVLEGFTELKMNEKRRKGLFEKKIIPLRDKVIKGRKTADSFRVKNTVMYGILVYLPVAALLFILPKTGLATFEECIKITAITLFATIPLVGLLSFMPLAARASVIISGLSEFNRKLQGMKDQVVGPQEPLEEFKRISVKNAKFTYLNVSNGKSFVSSEQFSLKVDDFYINKGELVILRGGNGSGKTTFMRLISGLYPFDEGEVLIDDKDIETFGSNNWRAYFTTLFSDFHLFDGLYGLCDEAEDIKNAEKEIERFSLAHKVKIDKNGFFSTLKLSSGQRKRMALAMALLENRPILLFDEVAADFDQNFREFFYKSLLPSLKEEGRTLLVISHDERYFSIADRILTLEYGEFI